MSRAVRQLRRQLESEGVTICAIASFRAYDPRAFAGILAAGLGVAGGLGGGGQAAGKAVSDVVAWGEHERRTTVALAHHVIAVVTDGAVSLYPWQRFGGVGPYQVRWLRGEFTATCKRRRAFGQVDVHVRQADDRIAWLTGKAGIFHRAAPACAEAIVRLASG